MSHADTDLWSQAPAAGHAGAASPSKPWRRLTAGLATLKVRLTLAAIGSLALGIGLISMMSLRQVEHDLLAQAQERETLESSRIASELSQRAVSLQHLLRATADAIDPALEALDDALEQHLQAQPALLQSFSNLFVASPDGRLRLMIDEAGPRRPRISIADRPYFQTVLAEHRPVISDAVPGRISGEPVIVFSHPIVRDGKVTSVIGGALRLTSRSLAASLLERDAHTDDGELLVIGDGAGRIIAHTSRELTLKPLNNEPRLAQAAGAWAASGSPVEPSGLLMPQEGEIVTTAGAAGTQWVVWRAVPQAGLLAPLQAARWQALRNAAIVIGVLGALTLGWVSHLLRPLRRLEQRAGTLFETDVDIHQGWPSAGGEIGSLTHVLRHVGAERAHLETFTRQVLGKLGSVMNAAPIGIAFTRDRRFELVSKAWCKLLQREESELLGARAAEIYASELDYEQLGPLVAAAFRERGIYAGEWRFRRKDGSLFWGQLCGQPVDTSDAAAGTIWTLADVTSSRLSRETLEWSATHDPLTGLANRQAFERRLGAVVGHAPAALLVIDLDRFKPINDSHGHAAGDAMLKQVAAAITAQVRSGDLVVRLGGDEFAVILERCPLDAAERVAADVLRAITRTELPWRDQSLRVGASIGLAALTDALATPEAWVAAADSACYAAKAAGRGRVRVARSATPKVVELHRVEAGA